MSRKKHRKSAQRARTKGFKLHLANYVGVMGFLWFIYLFTTPGGYPWPVWPMAGWGLGLFSHFVGAVLAPRWGDEEVDEEYAPEPEPEFFEEKLSSEYRMDDAPSQRRRQSNHESWDGVDVEVHDIDDKD